MKERGDYGNYCPVAMGSEVLADRWTPLIMRELVLGNTRFNEIARGLPGISRSLLVKRLKHLERCGVLDRWPAAAGKGFEYHLTRAGTDLSEVVIGLGRWAVEWLYDDIRLDDIDVITLTWWMHRRLDAESLPPRRVVVQFDHTAPERVTVWIILEHGTASVCTNHPRMESDVVVTCPTPALAAVFAGFESWAGAQKLGKIRIEGPPQLTRSVPRWFLPSPFAEDVERVAAERAAAERVAAAEPAAAGTVANFGRE